MAIASSAPRPAGRDINVLCIWSLNNNLYLTNSNINLASTSTKVRALVAMRLISTRSLELEEYFDIYVPEYAILSHT